MAPRPQKLNHVLEARDDGTTVTVRDRIIEWLRIGMPRDTSCFRAGIAISTFHHWLKSAARLEEAVMLHPERFGHLTAHEQDLLQFSQDVDEATAEGESRYFALLAGHARGGQPITKTTRKYNRAGDLLEETVTEETTLGSERALMWILERRYPANYPRSAQQLDVAITARLNDPLTEQERAKQLYEALTANAIPIMTANTPQPANHSTPANEWPHPDTIGTSNGDTPQW